MSKQTKINTRGMATTATVSQKTDSPLLSRSGGAGEEVPSPTVNTAALIREVTRNFGDMMEEKLSKFTETLEKISTTLESQSKRITEAEQRVSDVEDTEKNIKLMADGMDDMENRSRRDNIRVLNLKESTEGKNPIHFFEDWLPLPTVLGLEATPGVKSRIKIDRAHRSLGPRGVRPRPVIIKLHNSRDKARIMAALRATPNLEHDGQRIFIHQDLSSAVRERRRAFNGVCQALIERGIRFNMRFPATLAVNHNGKEHKFESQRDAENFLNTLE